MRKYKVHANTDQLKYEQLILWKVDLMVIDLVGS